VLLFLWWEERASRILLLLLNIRLFVLRAFHENESLEYRPGFSREYGSVQRKFMSEGDAQLRGIDCRANWGIIRLGSISIDGDALSNKGGRRNPETS